MVQAAKRKLVINKCNEIFKENPSAILAFQETHFKENDAQGMAIMARFKTHNSTYNGDGNRQKGASIFFSDKFWTEDECLYKSDNGDLVIVKLVGKNLSVIVSNVYAPNDHNEEYFDHLKDIMLDIQIVHPTIPVITLGDFNIVLEDRDSINRNANANEVNARRILKDLMYDINLKDCFRELVPTGGFTWQRNNAIAATDTVPAHTTTTMSRLDMILVTSSKASMCTKAEVDWTMVDSDHAGVQIWLDILKKAPRGPGLFKVNGSLLEDPIKLAQAKAQIDTMMQQVDPTWNPHQKLEFFKLSVRTTLSQIGQITSSMEKQELLLLETTLGNLYRWKEEIVMAPPGRAPNGLMIYIHSTVEIDIDIELTKAKIKLIKD